MKTPWIDTFFYYSWIEWNDAYIELLVLLDEHLVLPAQLRQLQLQLVGVGLPPGTRPGRRLTVLDHAPLPPAISSSSGADALLLLRHGLVLVLIGRREGEDHQVAGVVAGCGGPAATS